MFRQPQTNLRAAFEGLAQAVLREANQSRPFFTRPEVTIAGLPRLAPTGVELGGYATLLLLTSRASGGLARAWRLSSDAEVKFAIPLPSPGGTNLRAIAPFAWILPESIVFPSAAEKNRMGAYLKSHEALLEMNSISSAQINALVRLFAALGTHNVFQDEWVTGFTRTSLELAANLAWSLLLLSKPWKADSYPGWIFPPELRDSGVSELRGIATAPSGIWALAARERTVALQRLRGRDVRDALKQGVNVAAAWKGSLLLSRLGGIASGDPVSDWREVGRRLVGSLKKLDFGALDGIEGMESVLPAWKGLVAKHRHTSLPHLIHVLRYRDLIRDGRWDRSILVPRLREVQQPNEKLADVPLGRLGAGRVLAALRQRSVLPDEWTVLADIEEKLFERDKPNRKASKPRDGKAPALEERWAAIIAAIPSPRYERRARRKSNGGVRFLDVPHPRLASVQHVIETALRPVFPPNTWACAFLPFRGPAWHAQIHAGAQIAAVVDIEDFFGSVRPRHVEHWFGLSKKKDAHATNLLPNWSEASRRALVDIAFATDGQGHHWLPQGAPTSPYFANLAANRVDVLASVGGRERFGEGVRYSRYADDLVLSLGEAASNANPQQLVDFLRKLLRGAGWSVNESKVRRYRGADGAPLIACGVEVPDVPGEVCRLTGPMRRRARAALHHARHVDYEFAQLEEKLAADRGMLSFAYAATGEPTWLAYTSRLLHEFARGIAGVVFAESLIAGVADGMDTQLNP